MVDRKAGMREKVIGFSVMLCLWLSIGLLPVDFQLSCGQDHRCDYASRAVIGPANVRRFPAAAISLVYWSQRSHGRRSRTAVNDIYITVDKQALIVYRVREKGDKLANATATDKVAQIRQQLGNPDGFRISWSDYDDRLHVFIGGLVVFLAGLLFAFRKEILIALNH